MTENGVTSRMIESVRSYADSLVNCRMMSLFMVQHTDFLNRFERDELEMFIDAGEAQACGLQNASLELIRFMNEIRKKRQVLAYKGKAYRGMVVSEKDLQYLTKMRIGQSYGLGDKRRNQVKSASRSLEFVKSWILQLRETYRKSPLTADKRNMVIFEMDLCNGAPIENIDVQPRGHEQQEILLQPSPFKVLKIPSSPISCDRSSLSADPTADQCWYFHLEETDCET